MRIVAVADTHTFEAELGPIPDGDVFVHAGDLIRRGTLDELAGVAAWIRGLPHRHKLVIAGNHDWCFARARAAACALLGPGVIYVEDEAVEVGGARVYGSPWQPAYMDWAYNLPRGAALAAKWARIPTGLDVLVTHGPPRPARSRRSRSRRRAGRARRCADRFSQARCKIAPRPRRSAARQRRHRRART
ncbi:MAG: metallophosphoesterase [Deltaproteobacteria bacterium]|nr:metallophosphoesterase [Deltaproteobacteria bacterium]